MNTVEPQNHNNNINQNSQDAVVEQQQELTLNDIMPTLIRMTPSIEGIEKRMEKLDIVQQKVDNLATRIESMEKKFIEIEKSQDFQAETLDTQGSHIAKILAENKNLKKENTLINRTLNDLHEELEIEKVKRNQLEQYGRREMLEISGILVAQDENCSDIMYKLCQITSTNIKKSKIEVSHRTENGDIIAKFKDRPSHDALFANKYNLKEKSTKDLGFSSENSIFINESLSFDTKKFLFDVRNKCRTLGYSRIITDNGTIKVKTISIEGVSKWVKIITRKDMDKLT